MEPGLEFLKWAWPCTQNPYKAKKFKLEDIKNIENMLFKGTKIDYSLLEKMFSIAVFDIKQFEKTNNPWQEGLPNNYFQKAHNQEVEKRTTYPNEFAKHICKVHIAEVIRLTEKNEIIVNYESRIRPVSFNLIPDINIGQQVYIHEFHAIKRV